MEYKLTEIKSFRAVGIKRSYNFVNGENFEQIPMFWRETMSSAKGSVLFSLIEEDNKEILGISTNMRENYFDYFIAVATDKEIPIGMEEIFVDLQTYAVFISNIDKIQETTKYALNEFLKNSKYKYVENAPELEIYADEHTCKICIPIYK